jgi:hypothetical protein
MEKIKNFKTLKAEQKEMAVKIRETKSETKETQKKNEYAGSLQYSLLKLRSEYRHKHIAYCLMRGRSYEQIEPKCREGNKPNKDLIQEIINEYSQKESDVRACA